MRDIPFSMPRGRTSPLTVPATVTAALVLLIAAGWSLFSLRHHVVAQHERELRIEFLDGQIRHLDEVLTMSARMAAATGDPAWEARYHSFEPQLDQAIKELIANSPKAFDTEVGRQTDDANQKLVEMELRSFEKTRAGDRAGANQELFSGEYQKQKNIYAKGLQDAERTLRQTVHGESDAIFLGLEVLSASLVISVLLFASWGLRNSRLHAAALAIETQQRLSALERAARAKSDFLANMSHEIRTPMNGILGFTELLNEPALSDAERKSHIDTITRNGNHLLAIINDILDLSKLDAGKTTAEMIRCSPVQIITDVQTLLAHRASEKNLSLQIQRSDDFPEYVVTDPTRLRQILMNLVANAVKFTEHGGVIVALSSTSIDPQHSTLQFEVSDTGPGMSPEQISQLFQPFSQADSSTTRRFGGTGLGLSISKRLATLLGGSIELSSQIGVGSTFRLKLPASVCENASPLETSANPPPEPPVITSQLKPLRDVRILVAEDGLDNQRLIGFHLRKAGAVVSLVENGKLAIQALSGSGSLHAQLQNPPPFDLVLMDMQMPELDGYSATRQLRGLGCTIPIIAITAHAMEGDRAKCLEAGCDDYDTKPIDRARLIASCLRVLAAARDTNAQRRAA